MEMISPKYITVTAQEIRNRMLQSEDRKHNFICLCAMHIAIDKSVDYFEPQWQNDDVGFELMGKMQNLLGIQFEHEFGRMSSGIHTFMHADDVYRFRQIGLRHAESSTDVSSFIRADMTKSEHLLLRVGILAELLRVDPECSFQVVVG